jgi:hypothetical protein
MREHCASVARVLLSRTQVLDIERDIAQPQTDAAICTVSLYRARSIVAGDPGPEQATTIPLATTN